MRINPQLPPLSPAVVRVWRCPLLANHSLLDTLWPILSPDEQQRAQRFAFPDVRRRFITARAILRRLLGGYTQISPREIRFCYGPHGKPQLADSRLLFNVSHSGDLALIAVALEHSVGGGYETYSMLGVDLEKVRVLDYQAVGRGLLPHAELAALSQLPGDVQADAFFRLWVRHEAQVKAVGGGIAAPISVPVYDLDPGPDYRAALATTIPNVHIELLDWPPPTQTASPSSCE